MHEEIQWHRNWHSINQTYDVGGREDTIPGHVKWPRTQVHYVQVSVGGYSLISYAFQIDVEARTSNSAALFSVV